MAIRENVKNVEVSVCLPAVAFLSAIALATVEAKVEKMLGFLEKKKS